MSNMTLGERYDREAEFWNDIQTSFDAYRLMMSRAYIDAHYANHDPGDEDRS